MVQQDPASARRPVLAELSPWVSLEEPVLPLEERQQFGGPQGLHSEIGEDGLLPQADRQSLWRQIGHRKHVALLRGGQPVCRPLCDTPVDRRKRMRQGLTGS